MSVWINKIIEETRAFRYNYERFLVTHSTLSAKKAIGALKRIHIYSVRAYTDLTTELNAVNKPEPNKVLDDLLHIKKD